jgi:serine protease Do
MHSPITSGISFGILIAAVGGAFAYVTANPIEIVGDPWFGFRGSPLTPELAEAAGYQGQQGFLVMYVENDGPAREAGLRGGNTLVTIGRVPACIGGDLILEVNGIQPVGVAELEAVLETSVPGDSVNLRVLRGETTLNISVTLGEDPGRPVRPLQEVCN